MNKKNKDMGSIELKGNTITEQFQYWLGEHKKVSQIITFLSIQNAKILAMSKGDIHNLSDEMKMQIIEFAQWFDEDFDEITWEARMYEWGEDDALILRVADMILEEQFINTVDETLKSLTDSQRKEVETLTEALYKIRKDRILTFSFSDMSANQIQIPKTVPKNELKLMKYEIMDSVIKMIVAGGQVIVREIHADKIYIYSYQTNPIGMWVPIEAEQLKEAYLVTPSGIELEPEDDVEYICRPRELF